MKQSFAKLKTTVLGGYDKECVLCYLRDMAIAHDQEKKALQKELKALREEVGSLRQTTEEQQVKENLKLARINNMSNVFQEQGNSLMVLLERNSRLQAELDWYHSREEELTAREQEIAREAERILQQAKDAAEEQKREAARQIEQLVQEMEERIRSVYTLSRELTQLHRKKQENASHHE